VTPKVRPTVAIFIAALLFIFVALRHPDIGLSRRAMLLFWVVFCLAATIAFHWIYHRFADRLPEGPEPTAELNLVTERMPKAAWLAIFPPLLAVATWWWMSAHSGGLPWSNEWDGSAQSSPLYREAVVYLFLVNGWMLCLVVSCLAVWHGSSRAYGSRRGQLLEAVLFQWLALIWTIDHVFWTDFRAPLAAAVASRTAVAVGYCIFFWWLWGMLKFEARLDSEEPRTGTGFYFNSGDPAFLGPRGLNLASHWSWGLALMGVALLVLAPWLLWWME
jgi:hypothetical protein